MKIIFPFLLMAATAQAQTYTSWMTGDSSDVTTAHQRAWVLAGGGGDNDDAMRYLLEQAAGGDVVVIRSSGADGYNPYFYTDLGVNINSVESILINSLAAANDPYVERRIREAEALFIAGGDQYNYYQYWRTTPVGAAINYLLNTKKVAVGGTSAGMAILGQAYYAPATAGVTYTQALADPYHAYVTGLGFNDFLHTPFLDSVITDTHFDDRDRAGRLTTFLARYQTDSNLVLRAIACNEYTAVAIDTNGIARVFGDYPNYPEFAYFVQSNCAYPASLPENCTSGQPLTWSVDSSALRVYRIGGNSAGSNYFDLNDWTTGSGGIWQTWWAEQGVFYSEDQAPTDCSELLAAPEPQAHTLAIFPNPCTDGFWLDTQAWAGEDDLAVFCYNNMGQLIHYQDIKTASPSFIQPAVFPVGLYIVRVVSHKQQRIFSLVVGQ